METQVDDGHLLHLWHQMRSGEKAASLKARDPKLKEAAVAEMKDYHEAAEMIWELRSYFN